MSLSLNVTFVVAHARNRVIGQNGGMPWRLSADLKRFRKLTMGHAVVMGRRTFTTLACPLPQRRNIVLSRDPTLVVTGCEVVHSLEEVRRLVGDEECMVIGGAEVYRECLPLCRRIYLTLVQAEPDGDTFFPLLNESQWRRESLGEYAADDKNDFDMTFWRLERI